MMTVKPDGCRNYTGTCINHRTHHDARNGHAPLSGSESTAIIGPCLHEVEETSLPILRANCRRSSQAPAHVSGCQNSRQRWAISHVVGQDLRSNRCRGNGAMSSRRTLDWNRSNVLGFFKAWLIPSSTRFLNAEISVSGYKVAGLMPMCLQTRLSLLGYLTLRK